MHARYYDPEAGRFIMKDPVEGSLSNPITHGFRIKCGMTKRRSANDPVNKIDPGGTVTREAFERNHPDPPPKPPQCFSSQFIGWGGNP